MQLCMCMHLYLRCLIVAPNIIHVGVEETVSVQLHGATKGTSMQLYFQDQIFPNIVSEKKSIILNKDNNYQAVVKLKVCLVFLNFHTKVQEYVQLAATSNDVFGDKDRNTKKVSIFLSTKRGYIFIQTDKPIYNPGENVKYRIFTLDNFMIPIKDEIHVQIINCKGFIVYNHILISDQILEKTITIPGVEAGKWKIIASYHKYPESTTSLEFEVKEYVLPTFEVTIEAPQPYHILKSKSFPFNISARYTYEKGVNGIAYIRFGLIDEKGNKIYLPGTEKQIAVKVRTEDLKTASENNTQCHIEGYYLYIAVSVLEKASGNLEEAESSSVKIVTSPYVVDLSKTKTYFTPGGVFSVLATATYPDGNRVPNLKFTATVTIEGSPEHILKNEGRGNDMGDVAMSFQIPPQAKNLAITVFAEGRDQEVIRSDKKMTASATKAEEHSYLSLEVEHQVLQPGEALKATLRDITPQSAAKPTLIYFMVWSKGQIVQVGRVPRTEITTVNVNVNVDMVPSFRLVAYYFTDSSPKAKIVADSVWVDVKDVCKGKVRLRQIIFQNRNCEVIDVSAEITDPKTKVALAAVDSAVYILNKNKLSLQKMFEYMNSYDLACSIGGGEDSSAVLQRAGLTFMCNCDMETPKPLGNITADILFDELFFRNHVRHHDRKCCLDGVRPNKMHTSCDERLKRVKESDSCRKAFKQCCEAVNERRKREKFEKRKTNLGRVVDDTLDNIVINEDAIYLRKYFPQSWMWTVIQTDSTVAPDSITTWEIQAVGISPTKGFCIAEPKPLRVFQDFFLSVNLPYSVKRNEQLQVKAVVYNYKQESLKAIVKMDKKEGLCTAGGSEVKEEVVVPGNSAVTVYFTVVPLVIGNIPITVLAYASDTVNDRVEKELRVEVKCVKWLVHPIMKILSLIPHAIDIPVPADEIPGGVDSEINLSLKGGVMGESVNNCLNLEGIDKLIQLPTGCAEQTMVKMSPAIHAMRYLDATKQWISLKAERRDEAQSMIQTGYNTVLTHKKVDGSYGAFLRTPSSIWLTAFIAKELTETRDIINVKDSYIQESMSYLMSKQKSNGAWDDPNRLYDRGMKGGVGQAKDDVPLTAFILISMNHALKLYELGIAMDRAKFYLEGQLDALESPYSHAITAYALSLHDQQSAEAQQAHRKLKSICFWNSKGGRGKSAGKADAESVETTAYALLSAMSLRDKATAKLTANWLTEQRKYGGGFQSTQDTVVALEALAKYSMQNNDVEDLNLRVEMCLENGRKQDLHLTKYNALTATASICSSLEIYNKEEMFEDYYNYDVDEDQKDEPMSSIEWFDLRNRRKRQISEEPKRESSVIYTVCNFFFSSSSQNVKGTERYIDHYEVHHNKVFLYFITETEECLQFGAEQIVPMGLVQPASAVIYDYYSPEKRCGIFYTAPHKSPMISKLCNGDLCTCAEGGCPRLKVTFSKDMKHNTRSSYACYSPGVDYAYVMKILNSSTDDVFMYYTTLITDVLQTGLLDSGIQKHATRQMILRLSCDELELKKEAHYLIMGQNDAISVLNNDGQQ
uniref:Complement C4-like n=1 Tax=Sinocyclocheilus grahami TaxID=75366 RepID=A0A672Q448_SINGR